MFKNKSKAPDDIKKKAAKRSFVRTVEKYQKLALKRAAKQDLDLTGQKPFELARLVSSNSNLSALKEAYSDTCPHNARIMSDEDFLRAHSLIQELDSDGRGDSQTYEAILSAVALQLPPDMVITIADGCLDFELKLSVALQLAKCWYEDSLDKDSWYALYDAALEHNLNPQQIKVFAKGLATGLFAPEWVQDCISGHKGVEDVMREINRYKKASMRIENIGCIYDNGYTPNGSYCTITVSSRLGRFSKGERISIGDNAFTVEETTNDGTFAKAVSDTPLLESVPERPVNIDTQFLRHKVLPKLRNDLVKDCIRLTGFKLPKDVNSSIDAYARPRILFDPASIFLVERQPVFLELGDGVVPFMVDAPGSLVPVFVNHKPNAQELQRVADRWEKIFNILKQTTGYEHQDKTYKVQAHLLGPGIKSDGVIEVTGVDLATYEEYYDNRGLINAESDPGGPWMTRSWEQFQSEEGFVSVDKNGTITKELHPADKEIGQRPVVLFKCSSGLELGTKVEVAGMEFVVIGEGRMLANTVIGRYKPAAHNDICTLAGSSLEQDLNDWLDDTFSPIAIIEKTGQHIETNDTEHSSELGSGQNTGYEAGQYICMEEATVLER